MVQFTIFFKMNGNIVLYEGEDIVSNDNEKFTYV